jgi:hypothetical protein
MFEAASRVAHSDTLSTRGFCPAAGPRKQVRVSAAPRGKAAGAWSGGVGSPRLSRRPWFRRKPAQTDQNLN